MTEVSALTCKTPLHNVFTGRNEVVAKVIFLHLFVILFTGGVSVSVHAGIPHPPGSRHLPRADTPPEQTPPPGADTHTPPTHPWSRHTSPPREADSGIRSMSGRYASYWNAFLSDIVVLFFKARIAFTGNGAP